MGIAVAVMLFSAQTPTSYLLALGGACAGMLPDALQFAYMRFSAPTTDVSPALPRMYSHNSSDAEASGAWH
jgi:hypothetical protein